MKVYLDMCAIQRPLDTLNQARLVLEAEAVLALLSWCEAGRIELVSSDALIYENEHNPLPVRREYGYAVLARACATIRLSSETLDRAARFVQQGIKPLDALHLSLAEAGDTDRFCTCDDRLRRQASRLEGLAVRVVSPIDLVQEIEE